MRLLLFAICIGVGMHSATAQSCYIEGVPYYSYDDIVEILQTGQCGSCHSTNASASSDWTFESYEDLLADASCGTSLISHGNAGESVLYTLVSNGVTSCENNKPFFSHNLPTKDIVAIESWINSGATEDCIPLFDQVQQTLLTNSCNTCHSASSSWSSSSYEHTIGSVGTSLCDDIMVPYSASNSILYQAVSDVYTECSSVPADHVTISAGDQRLLRDWINAGAPLASNALPVELEFFDIKYTNEKQTVQLIWRSVTEIATAKYIVQRSLDSRSFEPIGELLAAGGANMPTDYLYTDFEEYIGSAYYRLLIVDIDGSSSYSSIVAARIEADKDMLTIRPSVVRAGMDLQVEWHAPFQRSFTYGFVVDYTGREIVRVDIVEGINTVSLPDLQKGMYYLIIYDFFGSQIIERFVVAD